ncbi:MAG: hypothetical protein U0359_39700 [Byssovorax sp.]
MADQVLRVEIPAPVEAGLRAAQSALLARGEPAPAEEWVLPDGDHAISAPLVLGGAGQRVAIRGGKVPSGVRGDGGAGVRCWLYLSEEAHLAISGVEVVIAHLGVQAAGGPMDARVRLDGAERVEAEAIVARGAGLVASSAGEVRLRDLLVTGGQATTGTGSNEPEAASIPGPCAVKAQGGAVTVDGVTVRDGAFAVGVNLDGTVVELTGADVSGLTGTGAAEGRIGARFSATKFAAAGYLGVRHIEGAAAVGLVIQAPAVRLAGLSVEDVIETGGAISSPGAKWPEGVRAAGLFVDAAESVEATSIRVAGVRGESPEGVRHLRRAERAPRRAGAWPFALGRLGRLDPRSRERHRTPLMLGWPRSCSRVHGMRGG